MPANLAGRLRARCSKHVDWNVTANVRVVLIRSVRCCATDPMSEMSSLCVTCLECGKVYVSSNGVCKHTFLIHGLQYDAVSRTTAPFPTPETLEQAQHLKDEMYANFQRRRDRAQSAVASAGATTERVREVREADSADLKKGPLDVCCVLYHIFSLT